MRIPLPLQFVFAGERSTEKRLGRISVSTMIFDGDR